MRIARQDLISALIRHWLRNGWLSLWLRLWLMTPLFLVACTTVSQPSSAVMAEYQLDNGLWYDGERFDARTAYVVNGVLRFSPAGNISAQQVIDLAGGHVVPPFCEAHNHNIGGSVDGVEEVAQGYLDDGVFYVMMPGSFAFYREQIAGKINRPDSVDVAFANNGLTGSGGHPRKLREFLKQRFGSYPEFTNETFPDKGYFEADTVEDLDRKWPLILAERPDFIKVMLLYAEEYEQRRDDPEFYGSRGLDPALFPEVVRRAHQRNLRVAVHVETEFDMATALRAGADIIAHLPSYDAPVRISEETIRLATETDAILVTTLSLAKRFEQRDPEKYAATIAAQRDNLARLTAAGARLVVGSDNVRDTSRSEVMHLLGLGVLDNRNLLDMWTTRCAEAVFPDRKIGRLRDDYEASFVVLGGNPLSDFAATGDIRLRMKQGLLLESR